VKLRIDRLVALAVALALGFLFVLSERPRQHRPAAAEPLSRRAVQTVRVVKEKLRIHAEAVGTVRSRRQTQIASRVLAEVNEVKRQPGDEVQAGETLVILDSRDLEARMAQAEANLKSAGESLKEAQTEFERAKNLLKKEAITQQAYDLASFRLADTAARREAGQKALEEARILLGYATITAPFKGVLFEKHADPGDLAVPGDPLLGLYDPGQLRLEALVEEAILWKLKVRDSLRVSIEALAGTIQGQVSEAVPAVDPATRTGTVKIDLPAELNLKPGMFGRAQVPVGERDALTVPAGTVVRRGQLEMVFAVIPGAGGPQARLKIVRTGQRPPAGTPGSDRVEILSGVEAGEELVSGGAKDLRDGDPIAPEGGGAEGSR